MPSKFVTLFTDGGARGNPGPAAIGYVIMGDKKVIVEHGECIGKATNNVAEYMALLHGLRHAHKLGAADVHCKLDSLLVVEQLNRRYKVKDVNLAKLFTQVWNLSQEFKRVTFVHIRREENAQADKLVNQALDRV